MIQGGSNNPRESGKDDFGEISRSRSSLYARAKTAWTGPVGTPVVCPVSRLLQGDLKVGPGSTIAGLGSEKGYFVQGAARSR